MSENKLLKKNYTEVSPEEIVTVELFLLKLNFEQLLEKLIREKIKSGVKNTWKNKRNYNKIKGREKASKGKISHKDACILMSCSPAMLFFESLEKRYNKIQRLVFDFDKFLLLCRRIDNLNRIRHKKMPYHLHEYYPEKWRYLYNSVKKAHKINFKMIKYLHRKFTEPLLFKMNLFPKIQIRVAITIYLYYKIFKRRKRMSAEGVGLLCRCSGITIMKMHRKLYSFWIDDKEA